MVAVSWADWPTDIVGGTSTVFTDVGQSAWLATAPQSPVVVALEVTVTVGAGAPINPGGTVGGRSAKVQLNLLPKVIEQSVVSPPVIVQVRSAPLPVGKVSLTEAPKASPGPAFSIVSSKLNGVGWLTVGVLEDLTTVRPG